MIKVPLGYFCTYICAANHGRKEVNEKAFKEMKARTLTKSDQVKKTQAEVNKYIHQRDYGLGCISCDEHLRAIHIGGVYDAGHYRSRGSAPHLRFVITQIHLQCKKCNRQLSGNIVEYRKGFIRRYGVDLVERIESDQRSRKYTIEQMQRMAALFRRRSRHFIKVREKYGEEKAKRTRCKV